MKEKYLIKVLFLINSGKRAADNFFLKFIAKIFIERSISGAKRVLVIRSGGLGDFLFCVPALSALKNGFELEIDIISDGYIDGSKVKPNPWVAMLKNKLICNIYSWDRRGLIRFFTHSFFLRQAMPSNYDAIFLLSHPIDKLSSKIKRLLFLMVLGVKANKVYGIKERNLSNLFRKYHILFGEVNHKSSEPLNIVRDYINDKKGRVFDVDYSLKSYEKKPVDQFIDANLNNLILISPESRLNFKAWPIEKYKEIADKLVNLGFKIYIVGASDERSYPLKTLLENTHITDMRQRFSIEELIYMTRRCRLVITNDGGFAHLASMSGGKLVSIANSVEEIGVVTPIGENSIEIRNVTSCAPCFGMDRCPKGNPICVTEIQVEDVMKTVMRIIHV